MFLFLHNGWHWYSFSVDTQKNRISNCGGLVIWKISVQCKFRKKVSHFSIVFIMVDANIPFLSTETQIWGGSVKWKISVWCIFMKWQPFFLIFFQNRQHWYSVSISTQKPETKTLGGGGQKFKFFLYDAYLWNGSHFFIFS